ncbi:hypothetical protein BTN50_1677 (plasmid) [Candidatus Enterovibrio altilux]|uniref:Mobile element protein n=1 Tax=Candidatus Enterovibrio altilux TaxID=1927128 RepID=A0A291BAU3_9GAMM|nr:hypothetical protein BTN50_1677 [Candidatus Enterovibrio luxaltus]
MALNLKDHATQISATDAMTEAFNKLTKLGMPKTKVIIS